MFNGCTELTTFIGDLSSLTDGSTMFNGCAELTTFIGDLSSLTNGNSMFSGTNLSLESIECIADSICEGYYSTNDTSIGPPTHGEINITWNSLPSETERQALVDELSRIVDKDWCLTTNGELIPLFDSEKYETYSTSVQPLDLDSEPQTVYYVRKK